MNKKRHKLVFISPLITNVPNSTRYQRSLMLSYNFDVILISAARPPAHLEQNFIRSYVFPNKILFFLACFFLPPYLKFIDRYGVLYTSYNSLMAISGWFNKRFFRMRWIYDLWDHPSLEFELTRGIKCDIKRLVFNKITYHILTYADAWIIGMHPTVQDKLPPPRSNCPICFVTNGVQLKEKTCIAQKLAISKSGKIRFQRPVRIISVGTIIKERGLNLILKVLKELQDENVIAEATFVGNTNDKSIKVIKEHNKLNRNIANYIGRLEHSELINFYNDFDIGLCLLSLDVTNYNYAYPIKVFEYMANGLIVIATLTPATVEIINNGIDGYLVNNTSRDVVEIIKQLSINPELSRSIKLESKKKSMNYSWPRINTKLANFVEKSLG